MEISAVTMTGESISDILNDEMDEEILSDMPVWSRMLRENCRRRL